MDVQALGDLSPGRVRVVLINVGTDLAAAVALLSARVLLPEIPVLLVDCGRVEPRESPLVNLARQKGADLLFAPVRPHGVALDWLFSSLEDDLLVLLDSDAEIRDPAFVRRCLEAFRSPRVFGAGLVKGGPKWLGQELGAAPGTGMSPEVPWTPFLVLRTSHVREALEAGHTFAAHTDYNEVRWSPVLSRRVAVRLQNQFAPAGLRLPPLPQHAKRWLAQTSLPALRWARRDFHGYRPNFIHYDTGSDVHEYLRYKRQLVFAGLHTRLAAGEIHHVGGVSRLMLDEAQVRAHSLSEAEPELLGRLSALGEAEWNGHALADRGVTRAGA